MSIPGIELGNGINKPTRIFRLPIGFVIDENDKILLLKRIDRQSREPVKGGMYENETPQDTIIREMYEETGFSQDDVISLDYVGERTELEEHEHEILDVHRYIFFFRLRGYEPLIRINHVDEGGADHDDCGRFAFDSLGDVNLDKYTAILVHEIKTFLKI